AYCLSHSIRGMFNGKNSFEKRGKPARKSVFSSNFVAVSYFPVKNPEPTGDQGTKPISSSSQVFSTPFNSTLRVHIEYSDCTALTGSTAWARRIVLGLASDRPKCSTFPC